MQVASKPRIPQGAEPDRKPLLGRRTKPPRGGTESRRLPRIGPGTRAAGEATGNGSRSTRVMSATRIARSAILRCFANLPFDELTTPSEKLLSNSDIIKR